MSDHIGKNFSSFIRALFLCSVVFLITQPVTAAPPYKILVQNITFSGGVGRGPTDSLSSYYRGYGLPGTNITLTASMYTGASATPAETDYTSPMYGDTTFTVTYGTFSFPVVMKSGQNTVTASIPYSSATGFTSIASNTTTPFSYTVTGVFGDYAGTVSTAAALTAPVINPVINWNNKGQTTHKDIAVDPNMTTTETSLTIYWPPVDTGAAARGEDFYEYRIYYRLKGTSVYKQWNGSNDPALRSLANNPGLTLITAGDTIKHFDSLKYKYTTLSNLQLFTAYEFYIAAADIFGQETILYHAANTTQKGLPEDPFGKATQPLRLTATITDGITSYSNFTDLATPSLRTLRAANVRVDIYTITTQTQPDNCVIWFSPISSIPLVDASLAPNVTSLGADIDSVAAVRIAANRWVAYLPTTPSAGKHPIIKDSTNVRFAVQLYSNGIYTIVDRDSSKTGTTDWTFYVGTTTSFSPQPTKILNNVLTSSSPIAYPSYYLSEDGNVTIKVYDIKGRPVATILDSAFRRGGQNIKENGWDGTNKANRKVGIGLYYITITAKSALNGRVILDDAKKVVMKH